MRGFLGWLALAVVLAEGSAAAADAPRVVVTIKPVHALVAAIMRGAGEPVLLVDGFSSPHTFALRPSGARAVQNADLFIRWLARLNRSRSGSWSFCPSRCRS